MRSWHRRDPTEGRNSDSTKTRLASDGILQGYRKKKTVSQEMGHMDCTRRGGGGEKESGAVKERAASKRRNNAYRQQGKRTLKLGYHPNQEKVDEHGHVVHTGRRKRNMRFFGGTSRTCRKTKEVLIGKEERRRATSRGHLTMHETDFGVEARLRGKSDNARGKTFCHNRGRVGHGETSMRFRL